MAITATGYDGSVNEVQAAIREKYAGLTYGFGGATDFKPNIATGLDRTVNFTAGEAWGHHVLVTSDAAIQKQTAVVASGSRWDTYVIRRNWSGAGGTATVEIVQGSATKAVAGGLNSNPGVLDDQLICLARVQAGQSQIQELWDLRTRGFKLIIAPDLAAIKNPHLGMSALVGGTLWRYDLDATASPAWLGLSEHLTASAPLTPRAGWSNGGLPQRMIRDGRRVEYDGMLRHAVSQPLLTFAEPAGGLADQTICDLNGPLPDVSLPVLFAFKNNGSEASYQCFGTATTDGRVIIQSGPPGTAIYRSNISGNWSVYFHIGFTKAVI